MFDFENGVHASRRKERMAFEVCVNQSEALSLIKQITDKCDELKALSLRLVNTLSVGEEEQGR